MKGVSSCTNKLPLKQTNNKNSATGFKTSNFEIEDKVPESVLDWYTSMIVE